MLVWNHEFESWRRDLVGPGRKRKRKDKIKKEKYLNKNDICNVI